MSIYTMVTLGIFGILLFLFSWSTIYTGKREKLLADVERVGMGSAVIVAIAAVLPVVGVTFDFKWKTFFGVVLSIVALVLVFVYFYILCKSSWKAAQNKARKKFLKSAAKGTLGIPCEWFYKKCTAENITDFDNPYHVKKMILLIETMLQNDENRVPKEYLHLYNTEEKVKEYFLKGQELCKGKKAAQAKAYSDRRKTPVDAQLGDGKNVMDMFEHLKQFEGREKREAYIDWEWKENRRSHYATLKRKEELSKTMAYINNAGIEKERDWAVWGGLASGIGGAGAGVATAMKTMEENAAIRQKNALQQAANNEVNKSIYYSNEYVLNYNKDISEIDDFHRNRLLHVKEKLVFDPVPAQTLFDGLAINTEIRHDDKFSVVTLSVTNNYNKDLPQGMGVTMDGTFQVKVYCDDILVDDMCVALPLLGIQYGKTERITAYPRKYMVESKHRNFRFELRPNKLWLMEY